MNMLPRLKPRCFYDLVIEVAIVRPGPDPGRHGASLSAPPRRRRGRASIPSPAPEHGPAGRAASRSSARPRACRCSRSRRCASRWSRRSSPTPRSTSCARRWRPSAAAAPSGCSRRRWSRAWSARGYDPDFAQRCFNQIKGFGEYGFPESHAASFAHLVYVSAWLKCHYPAAFACALLNSQPMGFYAPAQIVRDAREHGVEVRAADVNLSRLGLHAGSRRLADGRAPALRLGLRQIDGLQRGRIGASRPRQIDGRAGRVRSRTCSRDRIGDRCTICGARAASRADAREARRRRCLPLARASTAARRCGR